MRSFFSEILLPVVVIAVLLTASGTCHALASNNVPLDSPLYFYLEKLAGFGLVSSDFKGIKPYSKAEAARLTAEAEENLSRLDGDARSFAQALIRQLKEALSREIALRNKPEDASAFGINPVDYARLRYVYVDGAPRTYERPVHDPGGEGVFGIGGGLRPNYDYPAPVQQHGSEGTPLFENNNGIVYRPGSNYEFRFGSEFFFKDHASVLIEPLVLYSDRGDFSQLFLNKWYVKLGGDGLELEVGRDENWLGLGYRNAITLANNARNFDALKLSSPEPLHVKYFGDLKYALIFSQFDKIVTNGLERQPYFLALKVSLKPLEHVEFGLNYAKQFGGPGVPNSFGDNLRGIFGGTSNDNTNNIAGLELRLRLPFFRNAELYGEFSGEDAAKFWPFVESYVAGFYIPRLTSDGKNDLRFEYFLGNNILYTNETFPGGYRYRGMPIGSWQGGASEEFFVRYSHWFSVRNNLALEYFHLERGNTGRVTVNSAGAFDPNGRLQAKERTDGGRIFGNVALYGDFDLRMGYGLASIRNLNLSGGVNKTNQTITVDLNYKY